MTAVTTENRSSQDWLIIFLRVVVGGMFILSAISKLYPTPYFALTTFEMKQLVPMGFDENFAFYFSRILVGTELALGILLLQNYYFKRLMVPTAFLMLLVFVVHLTYQIATVGNKGSCGCFGELLPMTPLEAIIKNVIAMAMLLYVFIRTDIDKDGRNFFQCFSVWLLCVLLMFMFAPGQKCPERKIFPVGVDSQTHVTFPEPIDTITNTPGKDNTVRIPGKDTAKNGVVKVIDEPKQKASGYSGLYADIDKGKKILAFYDPGCEHCRETAKELTQMKKQISDFPELRIIFMDQETWKIPEFFTYAGAEYTYQIMDVLTFWKTFKDYIPGVFYLWNGNVIKYYEGTDENAFNAAEFKKIVTKQYSELK